MIITGFLHKNICVQDVFAIDRFLQNCLFRYKKQSPKYDGIADLSLEKRTLNTLPEILEP